MTESQKSQRSRFSLVLAVHSGDFTPWKEGYPVILRKKLQVGRIEGSVSRYYVEQGWPEDDIAPLPDVLQHIMSRMIMSFAHAAQRGLTAPGTAAPSIPDWQDRKPAEIPAE